MLTDEYRRLFGSLADESLRVVALLKLEGHSNEEIAQSLDCGLRTVERKLEVIRKRWMAEGCAMSGGGPRGPGSLSATQAEELDRACDRFEGEWRAGARPDLAAYLAGPCGPVRAALVRELIAVDVAVARARRRAARGRGLPATVPL